MRNIFVLLTCLVCAAGCQERPTERVYEEVIIKPAETTPAMPMNPHAGMNMSSAKIDLPVSNVDLKWTVPQGWAELPGGGMRIVSFRNVNEAQAIDVSIVSLSGPAGGLEANLIRWANQVGLDLQSDPAKLTSLTNGVQTLKTKEGLSIQIYDFRTLQNRDDPSLKSVMAAVIDLGDATIFVKMTGSLQAIEENSQSFKALAQSIEKK